MAFNPPDLVDGTPTPTKKQNYPDIVSGDNAIKPTPTQYSDPTEAGIPQIMNDQQLAEKQAAVRAENEARNGSNPVSRVVNAATDRFNETQFGLPQYESNTGIKPIDMTNEVVMNRVVNPAFKALQTLGASGEAGISGIFQAIREVPGIDQNSVKRLERDVLAAFEVAGMGSGLKVPKVGGVRATEKLTEGINQVKNKVLDPYGVDARKIANENALKADAQKLPVEVRLSKGDVTGNLKQQQFEEDALKGLEGRKAQENAATFRQGQNEDLQKNVEAIQEGFTNQAALTREEQGLGLASAADKVKNLSKQAKKDIREAYKVAGEKDATVSTDIVKDYGKKVRAQLESDGFDVEEMPKLQKSFDDIEKLSGDIPTSINRLELLRKRINQRIEGKGTPEDTALKKLKDGYDEFLDEIIDQGLINGDQTTIDSFKKARSLVVDYQKTFNADKIIKKIVNENLEPEELVSMVFNGGQAGFKTNSGRIIKNLKKILGEDSLAFKQIKEEAFIRLISNQGDSFSGAKFDSALSKALERNGTVMRNVFTGEEIALLRRFGRVAQAATVRKPGVVNFSNSANKFFSRATKNIPFIEPIIQGFSQASSGKKAADAFGGSKPTSIMNAINLIRDNREGFKDLVQTGMVTKDVNQASNSR